MLTVQGFQKALEYWKLFLQGVVCTVSLSALTVIFGFILALILAVCRMGRSRILKAIATGRDLPPDVSLRRLRGLRSLIWEEQERELGFAPA